MSLLEQKEARIYVNILSSDGTLRTSVAEGTDGAVRREYETSDGKKGVKHELVYKKLEGKIIGLRFWDGDFGKQLHVTVENEGEECILSLNVESSFAEDFMKKLPSIDLEKPVSFEPFSFENDKGKLIKGISIKQEDVKLKNYYFDVEKKEPLYGFPEPEGNTEEYSTDDWKIYFLKARKFLVEKTQEIVKDKFPQEESSIEYPDEESTPEKIPF